MKNVLFIASEAVPFIKTGGLADVVGSLPKYFNKDEFDVRVMIPKYTFIRHIFILIWHGVHSMLAYLNFNIMELHFILLTMSSIFQDLNHTAGFMKI